MSKKGAKNQRSYKHYKEEKIKEKNKEANILKDLKRKEQDKLKKKIACPFCNRIHKSKSFDTCFSCRKDKIGSVTEYGESVVRKRFKKEHMKQVETANVIIVDRKLL